MKIAIKYCNILFLVFLELVVAFPIPDEVNPKLNNFTLTLKRTAAVFKPQLSKSPKQDEEEGGLTGYTGGLVDRLVGFGQSIFKEDFTLSKVFAGAATFIPGEAGKEVSNIFNNIAAPFNALVEKPLQKVQEFILGNQKSNATSATSDTNNIQPDNSVSAQPVPVSNVQAAPSIINPNTQPVAGAATIPAQAQANVPVPSSALVPNEHKSASVPVVPQVVNNNPVQLQLQAQSVENIPALANEVNGEEDDGEDNEDEDNDSNARV